MLSLFPELSEYLHLKIYSVIRPKLGELLTELSPKNLPLSWVRQSPFPHHGTEYTRFQVLVGVSVPLTRR